jgi:hypothetical protein
MIAEIPRLRIVSTQDPNWRFQWNPSKISVGVRAGFHPLEVTWWQKTHCSWLALSRQQIKLGGCRFSRRMDFVRLAGCASKFSMPHRMGAAYTAAVTRSVALVSNAREKGLDAF